jgi:hypothetical protein
MQRKWSVKNSPASRHIQTDEGKRSVVGYFQFLDFYALYAIGPAEFGEQAGVGIPR